MPAGPAAEGTPDTSMSTREGPARTAEAPPTRAGRAPTPPMRGTRSPDVPARLVLVPRFGGVLLDGGHRGVDRGAHEFACVLCHPPERSLPAEVGAVEPGEHMPCEELVRLLGGLERRPVVGEKEECAEVPLLLLELL